MRCAAQNPPMPLEDRLKAQILAKGPLSVAAFMEAAVGHYYGSRDPFGTNGDFTTAPEISQLFGEMIGVWIADLWQQMGRPERLTLLECGPGRGTLLADALKATRGIEGFHAALRLHLLESSPVLKEKQAQALSGFSPVFLDDLAALPDSAPIIAIGNEFLDALPVHQLIKTPSSWQERAIDYKDGSFCFSEIQAGPDIISLIDPSVKKSAHQGAIVEISPQRITFVETLAAPINRSGGAALFIDYGHDRPGAGDTLQAVKNHAFCGVLDPIGEADLTAHVDFAALKEALQETGANVFGPVPQEEFLASLGIRLRAAALARQASLAQKKDIENALHRLCGSGQMGRMFKVMGWSYDPQHRPAGF